MRGEEAAVFHDEEGQHVCFCGYPASLKVVDLTERDPFTGHAIPYRMWLCGFHVAQHHWEATQRVEVES